MMVTDLNYLRRYLDDPITVEGGTPQAIPDIDPPDSNINYYRRYLDDPLVVNLGTSQGAKESA